MTLTKREKISLSPRKVIIAQIVESAKRRAKQTPRAVRSPRRRP